VFLVYIFSNLNTVQNNKRHAAANPESGWGSCFGENRALAMTKKAPDNKNKRF